MFSDEDPPLPIRLVWPDGTYGLPQPISGCPRGEGFDFVSGWREHDTENDKKTKNRWYPPRERIKLKSILSQTDITHYFCIKELSEANRRIRRPNWPRGHYCIYKKGDCPQGFKSGFLFWDDENENNTNKAGGVLPDGVYNHDTRIDYCCRNDGSFRDPIFLPITDPFYLISKGGNCQKVFGMKVNNELLQWDDENDNNKDKRGGLFPDTRIPDHLVHFCYYFKP